MAVVGAMSSKPPLLLGSEGVGQLLELASEQRGVAIATSASSSCKVCDRRARSLGHCLLGNFCP